MGEGSACSPERIWLVARRIWRRGCWKVLVLVLYVHIIIYYICLFIYYFFFGGGLWDFGGFKKKNLSVEGRGILGGIQLVHLKGFGWLMGDS